MYVLEKTFLSCETCVLSNCFLLNNKICLKFKVKVVLLNGIYNIWRLITFLSESSNINKYVFIIGKTQIRVSLEKGHRERLLIFCAV